MAKRPSPVSDLTEAERRALKEELAEYRRRLKRRIFITLIIVAIPLYLWAAAVISAHNK